MLDDVVTDKIIRRVGAHVKFTPEEEEVVLEFAVKANFLRAFEDYENPAYAGEYKKYLYGLNNWKIRANIDVAIGVARRIAEGEFSSVNDPKAIHLIEDNMVPVGMRHYALNKREIGFHDFYRILKEYIQLPELPDLVKEWRRASREEDSAYEQWADTNAPALKIMRRYGFVRDTNFAQFASFIVTHNLDFNDLDVIRELIQKNNDNASSANIGEPIDEVAEAKKISDLKKLPKDISDLAQSLLDDVVTDKIIRRVGAHVNFTPEEEEIVRGFAEKAKFLEAFSPPNYKGPGAFDNTTVAIGVARRVAEGEFSSVDDPKAEKLIEENMVPAFDTKRWGLVYAELNKREIGFHDFYRILKEYIQLPELPDLVKEWHRALCEEDSASQQYGETNAPALKIMRRYGLVRGTSFAAFASDILTHNLDFNDLNVIRELIQKNNDNASSANIGEPK